MMNAYKKVAGVSGTLNSVVGALGGHEGLGYIVQMAEQNPQLVQSFGGNAEELEALAGDIRQTVRETSGVDCRVDLISRQVGLPLTSSGKLSRSRAKAILQAGEYENLVAVRSMTTTKSRS